ncbi:shikimate dehydrogenase [Roseospira navarrensis]|uniref:Shikimate dehydrogenase (NADP(+)) n=1 Tax=Roseospira navarrensis TaxID=140058 RepID=A0A7X1ZEV5_9PROT|nr:shikimate dehydrogenase [Roseospira navarrensis]MQX37008.1 shikimate dehydrogenase [Roseospira navarrensis]
MTLANDNAPLAGVAAPPFLTGRTRVAGVAGWPVAHSRSPRLHGTWLRWYGIDGAYVPLAVPPDRVAAAFAGLPALGLVGANVTVPHKEAALAACETLTDRARRIGAVNTLVVQQDGTLHGDNTDGFGFLENLRQGAPGWRGSRGPAVVLGAGGAARAVCVALLDSGAPEIRLLNRSMDRAEALAGSLDGRIVCAPLSESSRAMMDAGLLVNTTSLGMAGQPPLDVDLEPLPTDALVTDLVYAPLETPLLAMARGRGNPVVDGLGMLLHQARPGFEAWFGVAPEVTDDLRRVVLEDGPS